MNKIREQIAKYKIDIRIFEVLENKEFNDEMKDLRHLVMFTHTSVETSLDLLIGARILYPIYSEIMKSSGIRGTNFPIGLGISLMRVNETLKQIDFNRKVDTAITIGAIKSKHSSNLRTINNYRNWFSHPLVFDKKLKTMQTPIGQSQALKLMVELLGLMEDLKEEIFGNKVKY